MASCTLGHLALYYAPDTEEPARTLLTDLGLTLVDNGPPGFASALLDDETANHHDNLVYLAAMTRQQWELELELRDLLGGGMAGAPYFERIREWPELAPHVGIKYRVLDELETTLTALERHCAPGGPLHGHAELAKFGARPGLDDEVDARMAGSPAFTGEENPAFGDHIIQCFVRTEIFGLLSSASTIELDYAFGRFYERVPTYGS